jgi:hypothetical protein
VFYLVITKKVGKNNIKRQTNLSNEYTVEERDYSIKRKLLISYFSRVSRFVQHSSIAPPIDFCPLWRQSPFSNE